MFSIGIFTYSTKPRGSVVHATHLAEALSRRGHDVTLYALSKAGDLLYRDVDCRVVYLNAGKAPTEPDALIRQRVHEVAAGLSELRPRHDVYHAEDCLVTSGILAKRAELPLRPLVRTLHHLEHFASPYLRDCQRRSILEADAVACVSQASQRELCSREGSTWAASRIAAMPAAIAGALTLNGPRMRLMASTTCAGPYIQPSRTAASP